MHSVPNLLTPFDTMKKKKVVNKNMIYDLKYKFSGSTSKVHVYYNVLLAVFCNSFWTLLAIAELKYFSLKLCGKHISKL